MKLTILSTEGAQDSEFRSFMGRIEDTRNCFRDLLTFKLLTIKYQLNLTTDRDH